MPSKLTLLQGLVTVTTKSRINRLVGLFYFLSSFCNGMDNNTKYLFLYKGWTCSSNSITSLFQVKNRINTTWVYFIPLFSAMFKNFWPTGMYFYVVFWERLSHLCFILSAFIQKIRYKARQNRIFLHHEKLGGLLLVFSSCLKPHPSEFYQIWPVSHYTHYHLYFTLPEVMGKTQPSKIYLLLSKFSYHLQDWNSLKALAFLCTDYEIPWASNSLKYSTINHQSFAYARCRKMQFYTYLRAFQIWVVFFVLEPHSKKILPLCQLLGATTIRIASMWIVNPRLST